MSEKKSSSDSDSEAHENITSVVNNLKSKSIWMRLFFMLVVVLLYSVSRIIVSAVVILQFFWVLLNGEVNNKLQKLGEALATYTYQIIQYLTFNTEERPFPFDADWPNTK